MSLREAKIRAALRTVEGERVRWLLGKKGQLTTTGNVLEAGVSEWRDLASQAELLWTVHKRLGAGVDIQTFSNGNIEIRWRRYYEGELSDERFHSDVSLSAALEAILDYEDRADASEHVSLEVPA